MKERYGVIYLIINSINNKIYVGQTTISFEKRYFNDLSSNTHNSHLKRAIEKYGIENFNIIEEFQICYSKEELDNAEKLLIALYRTNENEFGYNKTIGGGLSKGAGSGRYRKVICTTTGKIFNGTRQCARVMNLTQNEVSKCCRGGAIHHKGFQFMYLDEYIKVGNIRDETKIIGQSKRKLDTRIICLNTNTIYKGARECSRELGLDHASIIRCCKGKQKSTKGMQFSYYEDYAI